MYETGLGLDGVNPSTRADLFGNLSTVFLRVEFVGKAVQASQSAVDTCKTHAKAHYRLGLALRALGDFPRAIESFTTALSLVDFADDETITSFSNTLQKTVRENEHSQIVLAMAEALEEQSDLDESLSPPGARLVSKVNRMTDIVSPPRMLPRVLDLCIQAASEPYFNSQAMLLLADHHLTWLQDCPGCVRWLLAASEAPIPDKPIGDSLEERSAVKRKALMRLGQVHSDGYFLNKNPGLAIENFKRAAVEFDLPEAYFLAGQLLNAVAESQYEGIQEISEGMDYLKKAASMGHSPAMGLLAKTYFEMGRPKDALLWCKTCREHGGNDPSFETFLLSHKEHELVEKAKSDRKKKESSFAVLHQDYNGRKVEEALITHPSPYLEHLFKIKTVLLSAQEGCWQSNGRHTLDSLSDEDILGKFQACTSVLQLQDAQTMANMGFLGELRDQAERRKLGTARDMYIIKQQAPKFQEGGCVSKVILMEKACKEFPEDVFFAVALSCYLSMVSPKRDMRRSTAILDAHLTRLDSEPDSHPDKMVLLQYAGSANKNLREMLESEGSLSKKRDRQLCDKATNLFARYVLHADRILDRNATTAHFRMGILCLLCNKPQEAVDHLKTAYALDARLPPFLRSAANHPDKLYLEECCRYVPIEKPSQLLQVLSGFRSTSRESVMLGDLRLRHRAALKLVIAGEKDQQYGGEQDDQSSPPKRAGETFVFLEQVLGPRKKAIYYGNKISCVIVSPSVQVNPTMTVFLVEDANRYPVPVVVVRRSTEDQDYSKFTVGTRVTIIHPFVRFLTNSKELVIHVETQTTLEVHQDPLSLCWACLQEFPCDALSTCAKCKTAKYCSPECQRMDWTMYGHNSACKLVMSQS